MNKKRIVLLVVISLIFLVAFFFEVLPFPVENMQGANNSEQFNYGGLAFTSGLKELTYNNNAVPFSLFGICSTLFFSINLFIPKERKK